MSIFEEYMATGPSWNLDRRVCAAIGVQETILLMELLEIAEPHMWFTSSRQVVESVTGIPMITQRRHERLFKELSLLSVDIRITDGVKANWYLFTHDNLLRFFEDPDMYLKSRVLPQESISRGSL